jgi:hypothetical protein
VPSTCRRAGRDAAQDALRALAATTTDRDLKRLILSVLQDIGRLPEIPGAVGDAVTEALTGGGGERSAIASAAQGLTERTGNRMADYLATLLVVERQELAILEALSGGPALSPNQLLRPPVLPSTVTTNVGGDFILSIGNIDIHVAATSGDPRTVGAQAGDGSFVAYAQSLGCSPDVTAARRLRKFHLTSCHAGFAAPVPGRYLGARGYYRRIATRPKES